MRDRLGRKLAKRGQQCGFGGFAMVTRVFRASAFYRRRQLLDLNDDVKLALLPHRRSVATGAATEPGPDRSTPIAIKQRATYLRRSVGPCRRRRTTASSIWTATSVWGCEECDRLPQRR